MADNIYRLRTGNGMTLLDSDDEKVVANFEPLQSRYYYRPADKLHPAILQLDLSHNGEIHTVELDLNSTDLIAQIVQIAPTCRVVLSNMRKSLEAYILDMGKQYTKEHPRLYLDEHGLQRLEGGEWFFVLGNEVLALPADAEFILSGDLKKQQLVGDRKMSAQDAAVGMCQILTRCPSVYFIVWGYTIASFLRSGLDRVDVDLTTFPVCAITGGQNLGKTTVARNIMLPYQNLSVPGPPWGELDTGGTKASTQEFLYRRRDHVVLLDDMTANSSASEISHRKDIVQTALRFAANGSVRSKMSLSSGTIDQYCRAGMVFTGEYPLNEPSEVTRLVWVTIDKPMTGGSPRDRTMAATALRHFLIWLLPQLDGRLDRLREMLRTLPEGDQPRLRKNYTLIQWALETFFLFAHEEGAIPLEQIRRAMGDVLQTLHQRIDRQIQLVVSGAAPAPKGNLCWYILHGYRSGAFHIVKKRKHMRHDEDCLVEGDRLLIRYDTLLHYLRREDPGRTWTKTALGRQLQKDLVITPDEEKKRAGQRIHGKRHLSLDLKALNRRAVQY